jgi:hypothetical protein
MVSLLEVHTHLLGLAWLTHFFASLLARSGGPSRIVLEVPACWGEGQR